MTYGKNEFVFFVYLTLAEQSCVILVSYQTQGEVEQSRAAVEQDGEERGGGGEEQPHVSAHDHPQRLQDLGEDVFSLLEVKGAETQVPEGHNPARSSFLPGRNSFPEAQVEELLTAGSEPLDGLRLQAWVSAA